MEDYSFWLIMAGVLGLVTIGHYIQKEKRRQRSEQLANIAQELGAKFRPTHSSLAASIKGLMSGQRDAKVYNSMRFQAGLGEIYLIEYSHVVKSGKSSRRVYRTAVVIPILLGTMKPIPLFHLQKRRLTDGISHWFGWPSVDLTWNTQFNDRMGLRTRPGEVDKVRDFFDQHEAFADFCRMHHEYRLVSDGRWLAFYKPNHIINADADLIYRHIEKAKELYSTIWPINGEGKAAAFEGFLETPEIEFWSDDSNDYDNYLKSLKN